MPSYHGVIKAFPYASIMAEASFLCLKPPPEAPVMLHSYPTMLSAGRVLREWHESPP